jgi:hypothetical protein
MTLFLRQKNEALDEDQKTLREQLGLYKKQVEIWEKAAEEEQGPGLEMLDSADYFKYKILISNFSEAVNQIFQNFGKQDFAGIGGLEKAYSALARFARNVIQGPYLTADKERIFNMLKPAIVALLKIEGLGVEDAFSATEKVVVGNILRNITTKNFEPLGFIDIPSQELRGTELEKRQSRVKKEQKEPKEPQEATTDTQKSKKGEPIDREDERFIKLQEKIEAALEAAPQGELKEKLKEEKWRLKNNSRTGQISQRMFDEISNAYDRLVPPPPPPPKRPSALVASPDVINADSFAYKALVADIDTLSERKKSVAESIMRKLREKTVNGDISRNNFQKIRAKVDVEQNPLFSPKTFREH